MNKAYNEQQKLNIIQKEKIKDKEKIKEHLENLIFFHEKLNKYCSKLEHFKNKAFIKFLKEAHSKIK